MREKALHRGFLPQKAESDNHYFTFGKTGIIEETLAYFGLPTQSFIGAPSVTHEHHLKTLYEFMVSSATDEQLALIYEVATGQKQVPEMNPILESSGNVFVSMPMNKDKYDCGYNRTLSFSSVHQYIV